MEDKEVVKALECCNSTERGHCLNKCPYYNYSANCTQSMINDALDLINRQKAEIEQKDIEIDILIKKKEALRDEICELTAEVERLQDSKYKCIYLSDNETTEFCVDSICPEFKTKKMIQAEAIKEFAERLKEEKCDMVSCRDYCGHLYEITGHDIDNLVKEMVGEEN